MHIRMGWSGETESNVWQKFDIELEQEDLTRLFRENGLPDGLDQRIPTRVCFQLLQNEAETLLLGKLTALGYPGDQASTRTAALNKQTAAIVGQLKDLARQ